MCFTFQEPVAPKRAPLTQAVSCEKAEMGPSEGQVRKDSIFFFFFFEVYGAAFIAQELIGGFFAQ